MKTYCCGFLLYKDEVALITKAKPEWQKGKLNGVGGSIEKGETPLQAMVREFKEETGHDVDGWEEFAQITGVEWKVHFFRTVASEKLKFPKGDVEPVSWYRIDSMFKLDTIPNLRWLVPFADNQSVTTPIVLQEKRLR